MGTIVSNSEYFRTDADIDVSSNVAVNKDIRVTNFHATDSITVTLTDTQTYNVVAGETVDLFYDGTSYIRLNESGVSDALTAHINSTGSSSTTVHGINQGLSTSDTPTFPQLELNHATNDTEMFFQEGDNNRYRLRYDVSANILDVSRYNDDGSFRQTALTLHRDSHGDMTLNGAFNCYSINTGHGDYEIGQNLTTTSNVNFYDIGCSSGGSGSSFFKFMNETNRAFDIVYDPTPEYLYFQTREDDGTFRDGFMSVPRTSTGTIDINRPVDIGGLLEVTGDIEIRSDGTDTFGLLKYQDDGIDRFFLSHNISNDSLQIVSRNDDGTFRDTAISIPRTNDSEITIDRPVQINGDLDLQSNNITSGQFQGADKVTAITASPTDAELPTAQAVQEYVTAATGQTITGDAIPAGSKLISDGTPVVYTSDFDYPILPNTSFVPSTIEVDELYYDNTNNVKFPGQRWMKGIFDEYTNVIDNNVLPTPGTNCDVSFDEDGWIRVEATAASSASNTTAASYSFPTFSTVGAFSCLIKRGGSTPMSQIGSAGSNSGVNIEVNWSTKSIVYQSSTVDVSKSFFLSDDIVFISGVGANTGSTILRLYAEDYGSATSGNYSLYKQISLTDTIYPTPYVIGTHVQDNLSYDLDWGNEGTLEFWVDIQHEYNPSAVIVYFGNRIYNSTANNVIQLYYDNSSRKYIIWLGNSAGTNHNFTTDAYTSGTWIGRGFHHFKIIYSTTNNANVQLRIDGGDDDISTRPTLTGTFDLLPYLTIGSRIPTTGPIAILNSLIDDILWQPTVDTSSTHYTGGNPYIKSNKTYGSNGNYSVDEQGNVVGTSFRENNQIEFFDILPDGARLLLDGTPNRTTSDGAEPLATHDTQFYESARKEIDGKIYDNPFVAFPGIRGASYSFEGGQNYLTDWYAWFSGLNDASRIQEGEWIRAYNGTAGGNYVTQGRTVGSAFVGLYHVIVKNIDATTTDVTDSGLGPRITWATESVGTSDSSINIIDYHFYEAGQICEIWWWRSNTFTNIAFRVYPDTSNAGRSVLFKQPMALAFGTGREPPRVPYFSGYKIGTKSAYQLDWGEQGTIEFWAEITFDYDTSTDKVFFDNRAGVVQASQINVIEFFYRSSDDKFYLQLRNSSNTASDWTSATMTSSTFPTPNQWHHFKVTYDLNDTNNMHIYIDGEDDIIDTRGTLTGTYTLLQTVTIGSEAVEYTLAAINGGISDFTFFPYVDITHDHYRSKKPYIAKNKKINNSGSYSIDEEGNLSVKSIDSIEPIPGEWEQIWGGVSGSTPFNTELPSGMYLIKCSNNTSNNTTYSFIIRHRSGQKSRSTSIVTVADPNQRTYLEINPTDGLIINNASTEFLNRYREVWRLIE